MTSFTKMPRDEALFEASVAACLIGSKAMGKMGSTKGASEPCATTEKLAVDLGYALVLVRGMDADRRELVIRLCTEAGAMMEDASADAILCAGLDEAGLREVVGRLDDAARRLCAILAGAAALMGPNGHPALAD